MFKTILYIAFGGAIGSVLRYLTTVLVGRYWNHIFPLATFLTNIIGCFLIGYAIGYLQKNNLMDSNFKWFLVTGICGGFTTFSAFGAENQELLGTNHFLISFLYIGISIFLGILAVGFGLFMTKL